MPNERIIEILEKKMIIDAIDEKRLAPHGILMHVYSLHEYASEADVIADEGTPKTIIVRIVVSHIEVNEKSENIP